jgi:K+-sensing histidine kinase KdpD
MSPSGSPLESLRRSLSRGWPTDFISISLPRPRFIFLITAIALRWGFLEASIVSLLSVACLDYFFSLQPLFRFYMTDTHDWVALVTFESVALLVSRLSNQVSRHARESEMHRSQLQKLYELSQNVLLLDRQNQSISSLPA